MKIVMEYYEIVESNENRSVGGVYMHNVAGRVQSSSGGSVFRSGPDRD